MAKPRGARCRLFGIVGALLCTILVVWQQGAPDAHGTAGGPAHYDDFLMSTFGSLPADTSFDAAYDFNSEILDQAWAFVAAISNVSYIDSPLFLEYVHDLDFFDTAWQQLLSTIGNVSYYETQLAQLQSWSSGANEARTSVGRSDVGERNLPERRVGWLGRLLGRGRRQQHHQHQHPPRFPWANRNADHERPKNGQCGKRRGLLKLFRRRRKNECESVSSLPQRAEESVVKERVALIQTLKAQLAEEPELAQLAAVSGFKLDDDATLGRYLASTFWNLEFRDQTVKELISETVRWRVDNVAGLTRADVIEAADSGQMYVGGFDLKGRPIVIYTPTTESAAPIESSINFLVYNLERALNLGAASTGASEYTFIIDLQRTKAGPPLGTIKASFEVMGKHYPMRCGHILLLHGGSMIQFIWRVLEPVVPERTRSKVRIVPERDEEATLRDFIAPDQLEDRFEGGQLPSFNMNVDEYLTDLR